MKNLKKVFALVVAFSMMLSVVAFAAYPDVTDETPYASAITTLTALGIVSGDDQGNFNPDSTITRAEFTKIVCEIQNMGGEGNKGATAFTDVPADHWASGYINFASSMGIINGMGDGTFNPEGPVTYEQAVKMLVATLGYEPMAASMGGYPTGYLAIAQQRGVLKSITAPASTAEATRGLIAQITYNALDVPMMVQTGFGSDITYEVQDGSNYTARTTLLTSKLDVAKLAGEVVANEKVSYVSNSSTPAKDGYIKFRADENFKNTDDTWQIGSSISNTTTFDFAVGETNASDLLGFRCVAYAREVASNDFELVAIVPEEGKNNTLTVDMADVDDSDRFVIDTTDDTFKLAYFESDDARRSTQVDLAYQNDDNNTEFVVIWNNQNGYQGTSTNVESLRQIKQSVSSLAARLTMVDWNNDDLYDLIKVDAYDHVVVDEVDAEEGIIRTMGGDRIDLQLDDSDVNVTIRDVDGNAVELDSIAQNDVLAIISDATGKLRAGNFTTMDITVLKADTNMISGTVTEKDASSDSTKQTVAIDGESYTLSNASSSSVTYISGLERLDVSSEGVFYLGIDGKIFDWDGSRAASGEYGVILAAGDNGGTFTDSIAVKLLTTGGIATYEITDRIKIKAAFGVNKDNTRYYTTESFDIEMDSTDSSNILDAEAFDGTNFDSLIDEDTNAFDFFAEAFPEIKSVTDQDATQLVTRFVKYKVNSNGTITEIMPASNAQGSSFAETFDSSLSTDQLADPTNPDKLTLGSLSGEYRASTNRLCGDYLTDDTVVFSINTNQLTNSKVLSVSSLADEGTYNAVMFDELDDGYGAVLLLGGSTTFTTENGMAIATRVSTAVDENGDDIVRVTFVQNGDSEEKVVTFNEDSYNDEDYSSAEFDTLSQGSVFLYQADANGLVDTYAVIGHISNSSSTPFVFADPDLEGYPFDAGSNDTASFRLGYLNRTMSGNRVEIVFGDGTTATYKIDGGVNEYFYNNANSNNVRVEVGSFESGDVTELIEDEDNNTAEVSYVLVRYLNQDELVDIYSFNDRYTIKY